MAECVLCANPPTCPACGSPGYWDMVVASPDGTHVHGHATCPRHGCCHCPTPAADRTEVTAYDGSPWRTWLTTRGIAEGGLRPTVVHGLLGIMGVHHGHDLVIVQGADAAHPDRCLWVGEPGQARALAAALVERADRAAAAQRSAEQAMTRPCGARGFADVGLTPTTGCILPAGHDGQHRCEGSDLEDAAARKPSPDSSWARTTEAGHGG